MWGKLVIEDGHIEKRISQKRKLEENTRKPLADQEGWHGLSHALRTFAEKDITATVGSRLHKEYLEGFGVSGYSHGQIPSRAVGEC